MYFVINALALVGAVTTCWFGLRLLATGIDVVQRWRKARSGDVNAWKVDGE